MEKFSKDLSIDLLNNIVQTIEILTPLSLPWNIWRVQNIYFYMAKSGEIDKKADPILTDLFKKLGDLIKVKGTFN